MKNIILVLIVILFIFGCDSSEVIDYSDDTLGACVFTAYNEWMSMTYVYAFEYKGKEYLVHSRGGIIEVTE